MNKRLAGFALILVIVLACNFLLTAEVSCGPGIVPTRLWPTPIPYP